MAEPTETAPPESEYTQAEAYAPMEAAAADAVAALPEFPGFAMREWAELPCSHDGMDDPDFVNVEIRYTFSDEDSAGEPVRGEYVAALRAHWTGLGYEITTDTEDEGSDGRVDRDLAVKLDDGITLWYSVWGAAALMIQSGCVPVSEPGDIEYIPPTGGIEAGSERDFVERYFPDGIPTEEAGADAVAPFGEGKAATDPFESPASFEDQL